MFGTGGVGLMGLDTDDRYQQLAVENCSIAIWSRLTANSQTAEVVPTILEKIGGKGAVVDFVGSEQTASLALGFLSGGGTYVNVGLFGDELRAPLAVLALR
ncbi:hypothetical protein [Sinorhizobium sp. GL28]|uniref:hypothetical protein n=1 Tax=Sinorhizobium sp. GL28 TaxID=1358418 RepID=UPI00071C58CB|nr:hypothetical protein [Sinorhizobium sp. GL28]KSV83903.1 hypothetical protein N184_34075 [Sinorhizobium sp. GL28]